MTRLAAGLDRVAFQVRSKLGRRFDPGLRRRGPDFLGIGAQKAGTTWLYECLRRHPDLFLPPAKELHYFDQRLYRSFRSYSDCFVEAGSRLCGEITPAYAILPSERIRLIKRWLPSLKLLFVIRNPIERAWSQAVMELSHRRGRPAETIARDDWIAFLRSPTCVERSDYATTIERWTGAYGADRLFLGFFDDLVARPARFLEGVFRFLGVPAPSDWSDYPLHDRVRPAAAREFPSTEPVRIPPLVLDFLQEQYRDMIDRLALDYPEPVGSWQG